MTRAALIAALVLVAHVASAAPRDAAAKADFQRGVKAYQKGDYAAASAAFAKSYNAEEDVETLFAWAQAERQQGDCGEAIRLYRMLEKQNLPAENRQVIISKRKECQQILDAAPKPEPDTTPPPVHPTKPRDNDTESDAGQDQEPGHVRKPRAHHDEDHAWWKDPIGDTLTGLGVVGLGVGASFLVKSYNDSQNLATYDDAKPAGKLGVGFTVGGAALLTAGLVRYAMLPSDHATVVGGWASPTGGGLAILGRF